MVKTIAFVLVGLIAVLAGVVSMQPDSFRIERSTVVKAPPDNVYALVQDFHQWQSWSPWEKLDLTMKRNYSGAASGQGAVYAWDGSGETGAGRMEITLAVPASALQIRLDFSRPFEAHNIAEFAFVAQADGTRVTWAMHGPANAVSKLMGLFFSMDSLVGKDFEAGLAAMKALAEK